MTDTYFLKKEILAIKRRTNRNFHGENFEFIAKKLHSPLLKEFKEINKAHNKQGSFSYDLSQKRYSAYQKLMEELRKKSPSEFNLVNRSL